MEDPPGPQLPPRPEAPQPRRHNPSRSRSPKKPGTAASSPTRSGLASFNIYSDSQPEKESPGGAGAGGESEVGDERGRGRSRESIDKQLEIHEKFERLLRSAPTITQATASATTTQEHRPSLFVQTPEDRAELVDEEEEDLITLTPDNYKSYMAAEKAGEGGVFTRTNTSTAISTAVDRNTDTSTSSLSSTDHPAIDTLFDFHEGGKLNLKVLLERYMAHAHTSPEVFDGIVEEDTEGAPKIDEETGHVRRRERPPTPYHPHYQLLVWRSIPGEEKGGPGIGGRDGTSSLPPPHGHGPFQRLAIPISPTYAQILCRAHPGSVVPISPSNPFPFDQLGGDAFPEKFQVVADTQLYEIVSEILRYHERGFGRWVVAGFGRRVAWVSRSDGKGVVQAVEAVVVIECTGKVQAGYQGFLPPGQGASGVDEKAAPPTLAGGADAEMEASMLREEESDEEREAQKEEKRDIEFSPILGRNVTTQRPGGAGARKELVSPLKSVLKKSYHEGMERTARGTPYLQKKPRRTRDLSDGEEDSQDGRVDLGRSPAAKPKLSQPVFRQGSGSGTPGGGAAGTPSRAGSGGRNAMQLREPYPNLAVPRGSLLSSRYARPPVSQVSTPAPAARTRQISDGVTPEYARMQGIITPVDYTPPHSHNANQGAEESNDNSNGGDDDELDSEAASRVYGKFNRHLGITPSQAMLEYKAKQHLGLGGFENTIRLVVPTPPHGTQQQPPKAPVMQPLQAPARTPAPQQLQTPAVKKKFPFSFSPPPAPKTPSYAQPTKAAEIRSAVNSPTKSLGGQTPGRGMPQSAKKPWKAGSSANSAREALLELEHERGRKEARAKQLALNAKPGSKREMRFEARSTVRSRSRGREGVDRYGGKLAKGNTGSAKVSATGSTAAPSAASSVRSRSRPTATYAAPSVASSARSRSRPTTVGATSGAVRPRSRAGSQTRPAVDRYGGNLKSTTYVDKAGVVRTVIHNKDGQQGEKGRAAGGAEKTTRPPFGGGGGASVKGRPPFGGGGGGRKGSVDGKKSSHEVYLFSFELYEQLHGSNYNNNSSLLYYYILLLLTDPRFVSRTLFVSQMPSPPILPNEVQTAQSRHYLVLFLPPPSRDSSPLLLPIMEPIIPPLEIS
ncbi:hypothetical protein DFH27DRAFT_528798 [Peziza echinospora]|nr:hypothetical protein DFH27DRAFT_528798 [Peziza echinospora]